jgi:hypothetical protein
MATSSSVRVTELDFDQIKVNIKNYLRNQSQFTDFDFDASNLSVLLDILAYNTHYNAVLANMISNEMFLDTALKRSSVVSLAKQLSYTPKSRRAAQSTVNIAVKNISSTPLVLNLDPYFVLTSNIDGNNYSFYTTQAYSTTSVSGTYTFNNVIVYQGRKLDYYFTVGSNPGPANKYVIPNTNIDTTTLQVSVQYNGVGGYSTPYTLVTDITTVSGTDKVYYLQENTQGYYEIFFGDDAIGANVHAGDVIKITYLITDGTSGNVSTAASVSWSSSDIAGEASVDRTITTISKPSGGSEQEDIDNVRFHSLHNYAAQGRAVTDNDYASIISSEVPGAASINVWGGENNVPPKYGTTFISIKPKTGFVLTDNEKYRIINEVLKPRGIVTAQHEFVDPEYCYLSFDVDIRYSANRSNLGAGDISMLVHDTIVSFMTTNLNRFGAAFYKSQLEGQLMALDSSILSVNVSYKLQKRLPLVPNVRFNTTDTLIFPAKLHPNSIRSSYFYNVLPSSDGTGFHLAQVRDFPNQNPPDYNGTGILRVIDLDTGEVLDDNIGSVFYADGSISLVATALLVIHGYVSNNTEFFANAAVQEGEGDVFPAYNEILTLDDSVADPTAGVDNGININVYAVNS